MFDHLGQHGPNTGERYTAGASALQVHDLGQAPAYAAWLWVRHVSENLRQADLDEIASLGLSSPFAALWASVQVAAGAYAVLSQHGEPIAIVGASPSSEPSLGLVWMLGTEAMDREQHAITRATRSHFDKLHDACLQHTHSEAHDGVSVQWLPLGGFRARLAGSADA